MNSKALLDALGVNKESLSKKAVEILGDLSKISEVLDVNTTEMNLELATVEKLIEHEKITSKYNEQISLLQTIQTVFKDSFLILHKLDDLDGSSIDSSFESSELRKSLSLEARELQQRLDLHTNNYYSEEIDHRSLMNLGDECEKIAKELVSLQEKNELYGDFPTVCFN